MPLDSGTNFGAYTVERLLGRGGMGEVYLATHDVLGRRVALKVLVAELAADASFRDRFLSESRLAASLEHPNVVTIYEAGESEGRLYLAMRLVDGADLATILQQEGPLAPDRATALVGGVAAALDEAHRQGLVHRDVKPGNVLVGRSSDGDERAYLADFGLVKGVGSNAGFTKPGQFMGSTDYVAPEQIQGEAVDGRADVYALACVLFEALAGKPPYSRSSEMATLWAHIQAEVPRLSESRPELAALDAVIGRGLAKAPDERYATAGAMLADAAAAFQGTGTGVSVGGPPSTSVPAAEASPRRTTSRPHGLTLTPLVGRDEDVRAICERLLMSRLVTLTGPGGIGKTRLGLAVADVLEAPIVDLTPINDVSLVATEIAASLGLRPEPGRPRMEALAEALGDDERLVLLDNLETMPVAELAPEIESLLTLAPRLHLLTTSRAPLGIPGEAEFAVRPLGTPEGASVAELESSPGGALLLQRARAIGAVATLDVHEAADLTALCRQLDGIPLALELAASQLRVYSAREIRLGLAEGFGLLADAHRPEKQRSLEATINWSLNLLEPAQLEVLTTAAVFAGSFDVASLAAMLPGTSPAQHLNALVSIGLVRPAIAGPSRRFALLETIRVAATQLLAPDRLALLRERHAGVFAALVRERGGALDRPDNAARFELFPDRDNIRLAFEWAVSHDVDLALEMVGRLQGYWFNAGALDEGAEWAERVAVLSGGDPALRLHAASTGLRMRRELSRVGLEAEARALLAAAEGADDAHAVARAMITAIGTLDSSDPDALTRDDRALELARAAGADTWMPSLLISKAMTMNERGDLSGSVAILEEAATAAAALGDHDVEVVALGNMAVCIEATDPEQAIEINRRALAVAAGGAIPVWEAWVLANVAALLARYRHPGFGTAELIAAITHNIAYPGIHIMEFTLQSAPIVMLRTGHPELGLRAFGLSAHLNRVHGRAQTAQQDVDSEHDRAALSRLLEPSVGAALLASAPQQEPVALLREILDALKQDAANG